MDELNYCGQPHPYRTQHVQPRNVTEDLAEATPMLGLRPEDFGGKPEHVQPISPAELAELVETVGPHFAELDDDAPETDAGE